jgi:predicted nucleotidyltransferase
MGMAGNLVAISIDGPEGSDKLEIVTTTLDGVLTALRSHESELRQFGVSHASVFGSVARGEATEASDVDVLVELDERRAMGIFEYARLTLYINEILDGGGDVVNRKTLKPLLRDSILRDAVHAF